MFDLLLSNMEKVETAGGWLVRWLSFLTQAVTKSP